jgi:hypothetical protein
MSAKGNVMPRRISKWRGGFYVKWNPLLGKIAAKSQLHNYPGHCAPDSVIRQISVGQRKKSVRDSAFCKIRSVRKMEKIGGGEHGERMKEEGGGRNLGDW